jgi:EF hand
MQGKFIVLAALLAFMAGTAWAQSGEVERLLSADGNHDGVVSRDEARALRVAAFARLDADANGRVSAAERAGAAEGRGGRMLERADANGDGAITRDEFMSRPMRAFDRFDANDNDALEASEIEAMRTAAQRFGG